MDEALTSLQPARISKAQGLCTFVVNSRDDVGSDMPSILASGKPLKEVTDHYVPL